jgi:hypothetical protein
LARIKSYEIVPLGNYVEIRPNMCFYRDEETEINLNLQEVEPYENFFSTEKCELPERLYFAFRVQSSKYSPEQAERFLSKMSKLFEKIHRNITFLFLSIFVEGLFSCMRDLSTPIDLDPCNLVVLKDLQSIKFIYIPTFNKFVVFLL